MKIAMYPVVNRHGLDRVLKTPPSLGRGEYTFCIEVDVQDAIFEKPPLPHIEVILPAPHVSTPLVEVSSSGGASPVDDFALQQTVASRQLAGLIERARNSKDPAMKKAAEESVAELMRWGVEVKVVQPECADAKTQ